MTDLIKRLRKLVILDEVGSDNPLGREAADRIEQLEKELAECRKDAEASHRSNMILVKRLAKYELKELTRQ